MPVGVVDPFEVIDVKQDHCKWVVMSAGRCSLILKFVFKMPAVVKAGERIGPAHEVELGIALPQLILQLFDMHG